MFTEAALGHSQEGSNFRDDDGAKRVFFGGERFIEGVSSCASSSSSFNSFNRSFSEISQAV